jgi:hypothetical protein
VDSRLDDVFTAIDSHLKRLIYQNVKERKKVKITFDDYHKNFTRYFELGRAKKLPIKLKNLRVIMKIIKSLRL